MSIIRGGVHSNSTTGRELVLHRLCGVDSVHFDHVVLYTRRTVLVHVIFRLTNLTTFLRIFVVRRGELNEKKKNHEAKRKKKKNHHGGSTSRTSRRRQDVVEQSYYS